MPLTNIQLAAIRHSLSRYTGDVSKRVLDDLLQGIKSSVESLLQPVADERGVEVGLNPATARAQVNEIAKAHAVEELISSPQVDFALTTARDVANGAGVYAQEAGDAEVVEAYPAWELKRIYDRDVPRGFRRFKGTIIAVPSDDWPSRWQAAGGQLIDGRMIALKNDAIWQALGDGVGGYDDTLGNPFPPFAFNSGYDVENIGHTECLELGLLKPGETAQPVAVNFADLFAPLEVAA